MATSVTIKQLNTMTVTASGTINLTRWKNMAGGTANGYGSFSYQASFGKNASFANNLIGTASVASWTSSGGTSGYQFNGPPGAVIRATGGNTAKANYEANATTCSVLLSASSDGASGSAAMSDVSSSISYTEDSYTVSVEATAGGSAAVEASGRYGVKMTAAANTGYIFVGWVKSGNTTFASFSIVYTISTISANATYRAVFAKLTANGGTISKTSALFTASASAGYRFKSWSVAAGASYAMVSGANLTVKATLPADAELDATALFDEILYTYTFDANGGAVSPDSASGGVETAVMLPLPVRTGYTFLGWYTTQSGDTRVGGAGDTINPSTNATIYAQWAAISYTIEFDANTGTGTMASVAAAGGSQVTLPACTYTKTGSLFVGWNTAADGSGDSYADEATVINLTAEDGATVALYAQWRTLHTITAAQVGGADVVDLSVEPAAATTTGGVDYWTYGTHVSVTVTPRAGKLLNGGGISVNGVSQGGFTNDTPAAPYTFELVVTGDTVIVPVVSAQTFACTVAKDAASATAITSVSVSSANVAYGGSVTFTAVPATGYSFAGWYDAEDNFVNAGTFDGSSYKYTISNVTAPISLVAKAAAAVSLSLNSTDHAALFVDGTECAGGAYNETLVVGTTIAYELAIDGGYGLDAWRSGVAILPLGTSGTIYIDAAVDATATILADGDLGRTITVYALDSEGMPIDIEDFITFTESVTPGATSGSQMSGMGGTPGECVGHFVGTKTARATAASTVTADGDTLYFLGWYADDAFQTPISKSLSLDILTNEDKTLYVWYADSGTATVSVGATNDSGELSGTAWVGDNETTAALDNVPLGSNITIHARARNGYRFDGWYNTPDPTVFTPISFSESFTFTVYGEMAYYARFVLDRNAICEWEGSDENKTMVWRSKVYVASKPFNPTSARVDADGYPVELAVGAWSSPDVAATSNRTAGILVRDQDARRLQMMRAERYLRIDVVSDSPVNTVFVGTSMEGLAV